MPNATLNLNDAERNVLLDLLTLPGRPDLGKEGMTRKEAKRTEALLDALGEEAWIAIREQVQQGARDAFRSDERCAGCGQKLQVQAEVVAWQDFLRLLKLKDEAKPYELSKGDLRYLKDILDALERAGKIPERTIRFWLRIFDKVDSALTRLEAPVE